MKQETIILIKILKKLVLISVFLVAQLFGYFVFKIVVIDKVLELDYFLYNFITIYPTVILFFLYRGLTDDNWE